MDFGFTIKPDIPPTRILGLTQRAEASGFGYGWLFDSHVLWMEPYPLLALMAEKTRLMRLGTCVTNPATRDITVTASLFATLGLISDGRMELGIGRGDSSRRVMGKKPATAAGLEKAVRIFRALTAGREIVYEGQSLRIAWTKNAPRVWVAGYGPRMLKLAGRIADGVILQFADPDLIKWCLDFVRQGANEAGRDFGAIEIMAAAPVWISDDIGIARQRTRWFPALVSNHIVEMINRYKSEDLPPALTAYVRDRKGYDYLHHCEVDSSNADFVTDEIVDRFCLLGPLSAQREKLEALASNGVTQFNIYLMCGDEEQTLDAYGRNLIAELRS